MKFLKKIALNKIDLVNEFSLSNIHSLLFLVDSLENNELAVHVAKQLSKGKICYVSLHKTADVLKENLKKKKINTDNMVFVDGITDVLGLSHENQEGVHFVSFPGALIELSVEIFSILNRDYDYIIFDSVTDMLPYAKPIQIKNFISKIINRVKEKNMKAIFYIKNAQGVTNFIDEIAPLVNGVINANAF